MATFSPSPAPRRRYGERIGGNSPKRFRPSLGGSRHGTPLRPDDETISVRSNGSRAGAMDVDDAASHASAPVSVTSTAAARARAEGVFARSEELTAAFYAHLPLEVRQVLRNADFLREAWTGDVDAKTGFALVSSAQTCFVWQHAQALAGASTCYIFTCPTDDEQQQVAECAPLHALVPRGTTRDREPALLLLSVGGNVRFWDSVASGLAGGEHFTSATLPLVAGEMATALLQSDPQTFIASTSSGRLFRLSLSSSGGRTQISIAPCIQRSSASLLSRFLWSSSAAGPSPDGGNINALTDNGWALVDTRVQRWSNPAWDEPLADVEVGPMVRTALRENLGSAAAVEEGAMDLELLDIAVDRNTIDCIVVLISYAGLEEDYGAAAPLPKRIYALVSMTYRHGELEVTNVGGVPYQSTSSSGAPMHPRLKISSSGSIISIQFGDAIAYCSRESEYQDRLELKASSDRTLGVALGEIEGEFLVLTSATMMRVSLDTEKVKAFDPDTGRAQLIKSTMMQAILYGSNPENPLRFTFPPELDEESLMAGAEQLSGAVLESDIEVVRPNHDLISQMTHRQERLSFLIGFINENAALPKMSQRSRQRLLTDAEKLYAARQLWLKYEGYLRNGHRQGVLSEAVAYHMHLALEGHHEDVMRAFFRLKVVDIGKLLSTVSETVRRALSQADGNSGDVIPEANTIVLTVLQSATQYREYNREVYGISGAMYKAWTSRPAIIDVVLELFDTSTKLTESTSADSAESASRAECLAQLPDLARVLFACLQERLDWLGSPAATDETTSKREYQELDERFRQLRPEVLETLRRNRHAEQAFQIAEEYRDFRSLAALCNKDTVYPPDDNPNADRIRAYVARFKDAFTTELCQWYVEHGELRAMFAENGVQASYLDKFFDEHPQPAISWIHDLGTRRFGSASAALLNQAQDAHANMDLASKHLMLSIGKLAHLAQVTEGEGEVDIDQRTLAAYDDQLDLVSVHEALLQNLRAALSAVRGKQSMEAQVELIVSARASLLSEKRALLAVFRQLVRVLLQGKAISIEDVVDVLTLKDNMDTLDDYATALHLLARDRTLPDARRLAAFRSAWRRIYLHDDWNHIRQTVDVTDGELNERYRSSALYHVLQATVFKEQQPPGFILQPGEALPVPTLAEISGRWPGMSAEEAESVLRDYELECDTLGDLELEDVVDRVRELAVEDASREEFEKL